MQVLGDHIQTINDGKWYLNKFVSFQYGELNENCNPHKSVIRTLKKYKLRVGEPLKRDKSRVKEQEQDKEQEQSKVKDKDKGVDLEKFINDKEFGHIDIDTEYLKFTDNIKAKGVRYKDYNAAFRNWLRNDKYGQAQKNGVSKARTYTPEEKEMRKVVDRTLAKLDNK